MTEFNNLTSPTNSYKQIHRLNDLRSNEAMNIPGCEQNEISKTYNSSLDVNNSLAVSFCPGKLSKHEVLERLFPEYSQSVRDLVLHGCNGDVLKAIEHFLSTKEDLKQQSTPNSSLFENKLGNESQPIAEKNKGINVHLGEQFLSKIRANRSAMALDGFAKPEQLVHEFTRTFQDMQALPSHESVDSNKHISSETSKNINDFLKSKHNTAYVQDGNYRSKNVALQEHLSLKTHALNFYSFCQVPNNFSFRCSETQTSQGNRSVFTFPILKPPTCQAYSQNP